MFLVLTVGRLSDVSGELICCCKTVKNPGLDRPVLIFNGPSRLVSAWNDLPGRL